VLTGVYSRDQDWARDAVAGLDVVVWKSPEDMLSSDIDAVYLCTPIGVHFEQGLEVLRAGKHLLCEKALTARAADSLALIAESTARDIALCEAFMYVFHPQFRRLAELVSAQTFGPVEALSCWFGMPKLEQPGFRDSRELGGGGFLDLACYPISLAAQLVDGDPQVTTAAFDHVGKSQVDMTGHATLRFPAGATAHLEWGFGRAYRNEAVVWGVNQSVQADRIFSKAPDLPSRLVVRDQRGTEELVDIPPANAFAEMLNAFAIATRDPRMRDDLRTVARRQAGIVAAIESAVHSNIRPSGEADGE